jgi:hypothetical protein
MSSLVLRADPFLASYGGLIDSQRPEARDRAPWDNGINLRRNAPKDPTPLRAPAKAQTQPRYLKQNMWQFDFRLPPRSVDLNTGTYSVALDAQSAASTLEMDRTLDSVLAPEPMIEDRPDPKAMMGSFYAIQEWEGYVSEVCGDMVIADLVDLAAPDENARSVAEIPRAEIPDTEWEHLEVGAVFRWAIGYYRRNSGQKDRISRIRFRHLPRLLKTDQKAIEKQAEEFANFFKTNT